MTKIRIKYILPAIPALFIFTGCSREEPKSAQDLKIVNNTTLPNKTKTINSISKTAFDIALEKATHGDKASAAMVGYYYLEGQDVERDPIKGLEILNKEAEAKNHNAYAFLWMAYLQGNLIEANPKIAFKWLKKLYEETNEKEPNLFIFSRVSYAFAYGNGVGVTSDQKKAEQYFKEALSQDFSATWFNQNASFYMTYDDKIHPTKALRLLVLANSCSPTDIMTPALTKEIEKTLPTNPLLLKQDLDKINNQEILNPNTSLMAMSWFFLNPTALTRVQSLSTTECIAQPNTKDKEDTEVCVENKK